MNRFHLTFSEEQCKLLTDWIIQSLFPATPISLGSIRPLLGNRTAEAVVENIYRNLLFLKKKPPGKKKPPQWDLPGLATEPVLQTRADSARTAVRRKHDQQPVVE